jgi:thioredoxin 1
LITGGYVKKNSLKTTIRAIILSGWILLLAAVGSTAADVGGIPQAPVPGMVTMVDLGAKSCIPCKMMAPILKELEQEYQDRAAIVFIDVWDNRLAALQFGIRTMPTQIFYSAEGKEMARHEGFMEKAAIIAELEKLGVR